MTKQFRDFESAREIVRALNLKNQKEWLEYCKSGNRPDHIPSAPKNIYKDEWKGYGDWLGYGDKRFTDFDSAKKFVIGLNLKNRNEWVEYCKSGNKPDDIPAAPWQVYNKWKKK